MDKKTYIFLGLMVLLISLLFARNCGGPEDDVVQSRVSIRYLVCSNCGAQYEIPETFFRDVPDEDTKRLGDDRGIAAGGTGGLTFRCRECGEIAARPGMHVKMNGKVLDVVGVDYDEERGIDEM